MDDMILCQHLFHASYSTKSGMGPCLLLTKPDAEGGCRLLVKWEKSILVYESEAPFLLFVRLPTLVYRYLLRHVGTAGVPGVHEPTLTTQHNVTR